VSPAEVAAPAAGVAGALTVTTTSNCAWTASSVTSWVSIATGDKGTGSGTVAYVVAPSTTTSARTATLTVAGQTVTVTQAAFVPPPPPPPPPAACAYTISPASATVDGSSTTLTVQLTTQSTCDWKVKSNESWLDVKSAASGTGSSSVQIAVERYPKKGDRTGTVTIADQTFTVTQSRTGN
jgi:hypothetical protein